MTGRVGRGTIGRRSLGVWISGPCTALRQRKRGALPLYRLFPKERNLVWTNEQSIETSASPEAIWRLWSDVAGWPEWNGDIEQIEISGPFAAGTTISMTPVGEDPIELRIAEAVEPNLFVDEAALADVVVRTIHRVERLEGDRSRVTYRMEISGPAADSVGPELGPAISGDFPETLAALVVHAER
jgi:uncharacterized protein YndB with AHSA1/START domain